MASRSVNWAAEPIGSLGEPAYASVAQRLRQEILAGVFDWGVRLKIGDLAKRYSISQMPVREALQQLRAALKQGDADAAERLAKQQCDRSKDDLVGRMRRRGAEQPTHANGE